MKMNRLLIIVLPVIAAAAILKGQQQSAPATTIDLTRPQAEQLALKNNPRISAARLLALVVPATAIIEGDTPSVMIVTPAGVIEKRNVKLGITSANRQEIVSGLEPGATVVAVGQSTLHEGERVIPVQADKALLEFHDAGDQGGK